MSTPIQTGPIIDLRPGGLLRGNRLWVIERIDIPRQRVCLSPISRDDAEIEVSIRVAIRMFGRSI